jgi:Ribbon-helix-helix protein, copG family
MARQLTITLDDETAKKLEEQSHRAGVTVEDAVKEAVQGRVDGTTTKSGRPFKVWAKDLGARPGVNFDCPWKLLDELDELERESK